MTNQHYPNWPLRVIHNYPPDTWLTLATTPNGWDNWGCLGQLAAATWLMQCYNSLAEMGAMSNSPATIETSTTGGAAALLFWYRSIIIVMIIRSVRKSSSIDRVTSSMAGPGTPEVLFWLRSSGDAGPVRGGHEPLWRWSEAGCWIISGGVSGIACSDAPGGSPHRGIYSVLASF